MDYNIILMKYTFFNVKFKHNYVHFLEPCSPH